MSAGTKPTRYAIVAQQVWQGETNEGVKSPLALQVVRDMLALPAHVRRRALSMQPIEDLPYLFREVKRETGSVYGLWHDTPSGFTCDIIGDSIWSKQKEVLDAPIHNKRTAVPAGFGVGKTWLAGRLVNWAGAVNPVGTMVIVTTATRFRQVRYQLWPHIRKAHAKGLLPGHTDTTQWKAEDDYGTETVIAYGFSAPDNDEAAMQGIHGTPKLMLVVDEAGGISKMIGRGTNNLLTGDARMLAIGNPAMNEPGSWFEELSAEGEDPEKPGTETIRIATLDSPAITDEETPVCRDCSYNPERHRLSLHLPDRDWLHRTLTEYGTIVPADAAIPDIVEAAKDAHPYIVAKVLARFPKDSGNRVMPASWVESAFYAEDPEGSDYVRLCDLGLDRETANFTVRRGSWVRLGVDVAADGGDEFAIYRCIGDAVHQVHVSNGAANADPVIVAERVLDEIDRAQQLADALGAAQAVRVKVDKNGLGWGVTGNLERWRKTGRHRADIVGVMVSENPERDDPAAVMRPTRKRDEMWLTGRFLLQPDPSSGYGRLRLKVDHQCKVQMSNPSLDNNAAGMVVVESKKSMKARGVSSPDRAEAALLAIYEPFPIFQRKRKGLLN